MSREIFIVGAKRTPIGAFQGSLSSFTAPQLGAVALQASVTQAGINPHIVDEVILGCVLSGGVGQAPARQASIFGGMGDEVPAITINKVCGSGLKAVALGCQAIKANDADVIISGGMESMTNAPFFLEKARSGYRFGHAQLYDQMLVDGLEDAYEKGTPMGVLADATAQKYRVSREEQDAFALESLMRACKALEEGSFKEEITPLTIEDRKKGKIVIEADEPPQKAKPEKIPELKPAFTKEGTVTAANASGISDGAAAVVLASKEAVDEHGLKPLALVKGYATHSHEPAWFTTAPVKAIEKLLKQVNWSIDDVDLFEINEAFAVVTMVAMKELGIPHSKVNIHGGGCALGHPIGASGSRLLVTLIYALKKYNKKKGIVSLCIGGGEAIAMAIEVV